MAEPFKPTERQPGELFGDYLDRVRARSGEPAPLERGSNAAAEG